MAYADTVIQVDAPGDNLSAIVVYMVSNDLRRSAWTALLSKASMDREEQGTMERVFLLPHCDVD